MAATRTTQTRRNWRKSARDMGSISWRKKLRLRKKASLTSLGRREFERSSLCIWSLDSAWNVSSSIFPTFSRSSNPRKAASPPCGFQKSTSVLTANSRWTQPAHRTLSSPVGSAARGRRRSSCSTWQSWVFKRYSQEPQESYKTCLIAKNAVQTGLYNCYSKA